MARFKKIKPRRQRLYFTLFSLACLGFAAYFIMSQFKENIMYFVTPAQIEERGIVAGTSFRLGGLVKEKSFKKLSANEYEFIVTDTHNDQLVKYTGLLPNLFREGQGIIATGKLDSEGDFIAAEILAKHDENYMPKEVYDEIKRREMQAKQEVSN